MARFFVSSALTIGVLAGIACNCAERVQGVSAWLDARPATLDFGTVLPGGRATGKVRLANRGGRTIELGSVQVRSDARHAFSFTGTPGTTVPAGGSAELELAYVGLAEPGVDRALLVVESDADNEVGVEVALVGETALACPMALIACENRCIDASADEKNCGACNRVCAAGEGCRAGICECDARNCGSSDAGVDAGADASISVNAGIDAASPLDASTSEDAGTDAGQDAGEDAGGAGSDAGADAGVPPTCPNRTWALVASGTTEALIGVWGSQANDVWAVGSQGTLLHWNGTAWSAKSSGTTKTLHGIWGSRADDVWAVGYDPSFGGTAIILHWNGQSWSGSTPAASTARALFDVWGTSNNDVWTVGYDDQNRATILHWTGTAWARTYTGGSVNLTGIWGSGAGDVWVVGDYNTALHRTNGAWGADPTVNMVAITGIWGTSATDIWAVGGGTSKALVAHWDGTAWSQKPPGTTNWLSDIAGTDPCNVWAVGTDAIVRFLNGTWTAVPNPTANQLYSVWTHGNFEGWIVGSGGTLLTLQ